MRKGELKEDTRVLRPWAPCPSESACRFDSDGICWCGKRRGRYPETDAVMMLYQAQRGGMPMGELPVAVWLVLGEVDARMRAGVFGG